MPIRTIDFLFYSPSYIHFHPQSSLMLQQIDLKHKLGGLYNVINHQKSIKDFEYHDANFYNKLKKCLKSKQNDKNHQIHPSLRPNVSSESQIATVTELVNLVTNLKFCTTETICQ